jgi:thiol-disulfide isomerase/thioredoxin
MRTTLRWMGLLAGVFLFQTAAPAQVRWSDKSFDEALSEAAQEKGFVMVDFFATWCSPCKLLDATAWKDPGVSKLLQDHKVVALKLDAEKEGKALASRYSVRGYPTVLLINPKGQEVTRFMGARDSASIVQQFQSAFKDPRTLEELRQAAREKPEDLQVEYDLAQKLLASRGDAGDAAEGERLLAEVVRKDPDNAKGLGAKALVDRLTWRMHLVFGYAESATRTAFATPWSPEYVYPDLYEGRPDPELAKLRAEAGRALEAYCRRLETKAGDELMAAGAALSGMKNVRVDSAQYAQMEGLVSGNPLIPANRRLCEGYYLVLGAIGTSSDSLNNAAWYFYTAQSHLDLAEKWARQAGALDPQSINAKDTLAHILFSTGRGPEAFDLERRLIATAKASGDEASAKIFEGALASWEKGLADQTLPPADGQGAKSEE